MELDLVTGAHQAKFGGTAGLMGMELHKIARALRPPPKVRAMIALSQQQVRMQKLWEMHGERDLFSKR
jgi:hypothetical protein